MTLLWKQSVGEGYSGLLFAGGKIVSQSREGDFEFIFARDADTGVEIWRHRYQAPAIESMLPRYGYGPHSTACISGDLVCCVGGTGIVHVLEFNTGKVVWSKNLWEEYDATEVERGYSPSPIVHEGKLILPVGGQGSGIVAMDLQSGKEVWKATNCNTGYASPVITEMHGQTFLICLMAQELICLDPKNGNLLWNYDYPTNNTVHVTSPLILPGNRVFFLSSNKATMIRVSRDSTKKFTLETLWETKAIRPQVGNVISLADQLMGPSSTMNAVLTGINQRNGTRLWRSRISEAGFLYAYDDGFVAISEQGNVSFSHIVDGQPVTLAKLGLNLEGRIWNAAAVSSDRIFVRDENNILAYRIERE